jgi:predicted ferric reductase
MDHIAKAHAARLNGNILEPRCPARDKNQGENMLWTIAVILIVLWLLGLVTSYTLSGFIHILVVIAVIVILLKVIRGKRIL